MYRSMELLFFFFYRQPSVLPDMLTVDLNFNTEMPLTINKKIKGDVGVDVGVDYAMAPLSHHRVNHHNIADSPALNTTN